MITVWSWAFHDGSFLEDFSIEADVPRSFARVWQEDFLAESKALTRVGISQTHLG